jgi:phage tail sheath protein FI
MPEYLAPGVYVEEVSFRSKSIEGVPTSTTGFAGKTRWGPVRYPNGPNQNEPRLITSFTEFERVYGGLENLSDTDINYTAHAARAFFLNGGQRLYISRVLSLADDAVVASRDIIIGGGKVTWKGRWPGDFGNVIVETQIVRSGDAGFAYPAASVSADPLQRSLWGRQARRVSQGSVVEVHAPADPKPLPNDPIDTTKACVVNVDPTTGKQTFVRGGGTVPIANDAVLLVLQLSVIVYVTTERVDVYNELTGDPDHSQLRYIGKILELDHPEDEDAVVWLDTSLLGAPVDPPIALMKALQADGRGALTGGTLGGLLDADDLAGEDANPDHPELTATGLAALGEIDDIAIVALPDAAAFEDPGERDTATGALIAHAENLKYRIAVVDGPQGSSLNEIRAFRGTFDSTYGALYWPWIEILDPTRRPSQGAPQPRIMLPTCGFVTGIYARSDIQRGVFKAPANEVVRGLTRFEANINKARQDVLNPEGINALRFFEGRGSRVWGARTMTSDPEWKYVNVRRLFIFLEHSIDKSTQWAVFEPNNERLWANIRQTIEDFLLVQWRDGALMGTKPAEAYFVRCDRTTMTQNDLDNGRLICLIGVAPTKPAEFVIFRIGQWTGDATMT